MERLPEPGFYRHYKHDPNGEAYNYTYEVIGVGKHTEEKTLLALYRPLYLSNWMAPAQYYARPCEMFMEHVEKDGVSLPRFLKITDPALIEKLEAKKREMYP